MIWADWVVVALGVLTLVATGAEIVQDGAIRRGRHNLTTAGLLLAQGLFLLWYGLR